MGQVLPFQGHWEKRPWLIQMTQSEFFSIVSTLLHTRKYIKSTRHPPFCQCNTSNYGTFLSDLPKVEDVDEEVVWRGSRILGLAHCREWYCTGKMGAAPQLALTRIGSVWTERQWQESFSPSETDGSDLSIPSRCLDQTSQTVKPGGLVARGQPCQTSSLSGRIFFGRLV